VRIAAFRTFASGDLVPGESCENGSGDSSALLDGRCSVNCPELNMAASGELRRFVSESRFFICTSQSEQNGSGK
jgi:hypothetical protein